MADKLLSAILGAVGGMLAGVVFKRVWKLAAGETDAPDAEDPDRTWSEVLGAAAVQGAIFGLVKAAVQRAGSRRKSGHHRTAMAS